MIKRFIMKKTGQHGDARQNKEMKVIFLLQWLYYRYFIYVNVIMLM